MFQTESTFSSVRKLLETDSKSALSAEDLDTELWLLLTKKVREPSDLLNIPTSVGTYFASRYLQWEVGNGGFVQAAENVPEWFEAAEAGYSALGKHKSAALIHRARELLEANDESGLEALDAEMLPEEWEIDEERVAFVRAHRLEFESVQ